MNLNEFEIDILIKASKRKSRFVGSGSMNGTYKTLISENLIKSSLTKNTNNFYNFFLTEQGYEFAVFVQKLIDL